MISQFIQKRGFAYRKFSLYVDRVIVESKSIRTIDRYEIKFEQLGFEKYYQADNTMPGKITCAVFAIIAALCWGAYFTHHYELNSTIFLSALYLLLAFLVYIKPHKDDVILTGGQKSLTFYRNAPDEKTVLDFIYLLINTAKQYYLDKYAQYDNNISEGQYISLLLWLKNKQIISSEEFDGLVEEFKLKRLL